MIALAVASVIVSVVALVLAYALEPVRRIDGELDSQRQRVAELEAVVSEWEGPADLDAALDFYSGLVDTVRGEVKRARGVLELRNTLHRVLSGLWAEVQGGHPRVDFELRTPDQLPNGRRVPLPIYPQGAGPDVLDLQREQLRLGAEFVRQFATDRSAIPGLQPLSGST